MSLAQANYQDAQARFKFTLPTFKVLKPYSKGHVFFPVQSLSFYLHGEDAWTFLDCGTL